MRASNSKRQSRRQARRLLNYHHGPQRDFLALKISFKKPPNAVNSIEKEPYYLDCSRFPPKNVDTIAPRR